MSSLLKKYWLGIQSSPSLTKRINSDNFLRWASKISGYAERYELKEIVSVEYI